MDQSLHAYSVAYNRKEVKELTRRWWWGTDVEHRLPAYKQSHFKHSSHLLKSQLIMPKLLLADIIL